MRTPQVEYDNHKHNRKPDERSSTKPDGNDETLMEKTKPVATKENLAENVNTCKQMNSVVDHGWAWVVVFGCFMMHFLVGGFSRSYSLIYLHLQDRFGSSAAVTAWVGGTSSALRMLTSPIATALSNKFTARRVVMVGGVFCGIGGILSAFAISTEYMFFSYSCFEGIGGALVYAPGIVMVGQYFDKYRSIAMGLSTAGSGLGVFCYPPIMQLLFRHYGFFGAMLITGAIMFNNILSGAVYRPIDESSRDEENNSIRAIKSVEGDGQELDGRLIEKPHEKENETKSETIASISPAYRRRCFNASRLHRYLDLQLFRSPTFLLYVLSLGFITLSYISAQMLVPAFATDQGVSYKDSVWLISVIGISDMIGRITSGFFFNIPQVRSRRRHYYEAAILMSGLTHFVIAFSRHYTLFLVVCTVHGLSTGVVVSQRAVICVDLMGVEKLSSSFGLTIFVQGAGVLIGPPMAGLIRDWSKSYFYSFIFTGICSLLAASFLFSEWLIIARRKKEKLCLERLHSITVAGSNCQGNAIYHSEDDHLSSHSVQCEKF